jgi:hypothetical protein
VQTDAAAAPGGAAPRQAVNGASGKKKDVIDVEAKNHAEALVHTTEEARPKRGSQPKRRAEVKMEFQQAERI